MHCAFLCTYVTLHYIKIRCVTLRLTLRCNSLRDVTFGYTLLRIILSFIHYSSLRYIVLITKYYATQRYNTLRNITPRVTSPYTALHRLTWTASCSVRRQPRLLSKRQPASTSEAALLDTSGRISHSSVTR